MSFPLELFQRVELTDVPVGQLVFHENAWHLRCEIARRYDTDNLLLALTGSAAGELTNLVDTSCLAVSYEYSWEIRIDAPEKFSFGEAKHAPSLAIGRNREFFLVGKLDNTPCRIHKNGTAVLAVNHNLGFRELHYTKQFSIWIIDKAGDIIGTDALLRVGHSDQ